MSGSASQSSFQTQTAPGSAPNGLGRGLFASSDFRPSDNVLHIQSPYVAVLDTPRLADTCSGCFGKRQLEADPDNKVVLKACTGCQVVKYCDATCQAKDWKLVHSRECPIYKGLHPKILPINARAIMRMVLRIGAKKNDYTREELESFQTLETHIRDIREGNPEQWERISLTSKAVKQYSQSGIEEELLSDFGAKFDLNSFNLTNALYDRIGLYIHPYAALINHSCEYNAVVGFDGPELYIKAIRPIAKDEQIFISYVDTTYPKRIRQKELRERYFFTCQCEKCSSDESPEPTGDAGEVCEHAFALLQSGKAGDDKHRLSVTLQALIACASPKTKQPFVSILDELIVSDISENGLNHAFLNCALRFSRIDPVAYPYEGHPIRAVHAWTLAKVTLQISQEFPELTFPEFVKGGWEDFLGAGEISLDYGLLTWTLLAELVSKEAEYCTVPGFRTIVRKTFANVHEEFMKHGLDPRSMRDEIRAQWTKLGKLIGDYFQCVLRDNS